MSLYLCNGAFEFLELDTFVRLSANLVFPLYIMMHAGWIFHIVYIQLLHSRYQSK